jgi:tRNA pseudouridine32 synthase/23S rRNA pseudouridine746 synthase
VETFDSLRLEIEAKVKVYTDKIKKLEARPPAPGLEQAILKLKYERKELSWHLTDVIHAAYTLTNVGGESRKQLDVWNQEKRPPTGMGDCCAPKLLQYAASQALKPISLVEFWWGTSPPVHPRIEREFYSACERKCHPILGFMLQGLETRN